MRVAVFVAVFVVLAGCTGSLVEFTATPATVDDAPRLAAGYEAGNTTAVPLTYPLVVGPVVRNVTVTSYLSGYAKGTETNDTAMLLVLSTPNAEVAGQSVNPFGQLSNRELATRLLVELRSVQEVAGTANVSDIRVVESREQTILGERVEVVSYAAVAEFEGERTELRVHLAAVEHGNDVVVVVGLHEETVDESTTLVDLMQYVEHTVPDAESG